MRCCRTGWQQTRGSRISNQWPMTATLQWHEALPISIGSHKHVSRRDASSLAHAETGKTVRGTRLIPRVQGTDLYNGSHEKIEQSLRELSKDAGRIPRMEKAGRQSTW